MWQIHAAGRTHVQFSEEKEKQWSGPFYFIQGADCQFGLIDGYIENLPTPGWEKEKELSEKCVSIINNLTPRPKFFVICGDLVHSSPTDDLKVRDAQIADFYKIFSKVHPDIPLVCVCGNHDVGDKPTQETVGMYKSSFGDDYFSFWSGGIFFIALNSQFFFDSSQVPELAKEQEAWLEQQLKTGASSKHGPIIFQHIPWFLNDPEDEQEDYFKIPKNVRIPFLDKFLAAGVKYIFCGHYHRNAGGIYKGLENVVTSAIGGQLGQDKSGIRVVQVLNDKVQHTYYPFEDVPSQIKLS